MCVHACVCLCVCARTWYQSLHPRRDSLWVVLGTSCFLLHCTQVGHPQRIEQLLCSLHGGYVCGFVCVVIDVCVIVSVCV